MDRTRRILACTAFASIALAAAPGKRSGDAAAELSGRYSHHFANGDVQGDTYGSDDVVEIVPVAKGAAYLRVELAFYNGHSCSLSGIGKADGQQIVYDSGENSPGGESHCLLTVSRQGASLLIDDAGGSCKGFCGMRGSLSGDTLPFASRRPIRYLARLKSSEEFTDALRAWQARAGGRPVDSPAVPPVPAAPGPRSGG